MKWYKTKPIINIIFATIFYGYWKVFGFELAVILILSLIVSEITYNKNNK